MPQELEDFKATVAEAANLLTGIRTLAPEIVSKELIAYLENLEQNPVGLRLLRNAITPKS